ncbi:MAG: hypothetical protein ACXVA9_10180 [Bdellovibrionales bacterium]
MKSLIFLAAVFMFNAFADEAPKTPTIIASYSYYKYSLTGTTTANTDIYKFGNSTVDLHLLSATWLYSPKWTFVVLAPYLKYMVETIYEPVPGGANFKTTDFTEGWGDVRLMGISPLWSAENQSLAYDVSVTLPTGSTDQYFTSAPQQRAAYNMQPGSGTPDFIGGVGYTNILNKLTSTARGQVTVRGGKNSHGYNLGNEFVGKLTSAYQLYQFFNTGLQLNYKIRQRIQGRDERYELNNNYNDPANGIHGDGHQYYHGDQSFWDFSWVTKLSAPAWKNISANLEGGVPLWQGAQNKDAVRLDIKYWFAGTLNATF